MLGFLFAALLFPGRPSPIIGLGDIPWIEPVFASFTYEGQIHFIASVHASEPILESRLILEYDSSRWVFPPSPGGITGENSIIVIRNVSRLPFPFTLVRYWWEADFQSGVSVSSAGKTILYYDGAVSWKPLTRGGLMLYWVDGELQEVNDAADLALMSIGTISAELETPIPNNLTLAIYPHLADLQAAMGDRLRGWEGAVSNLDSGIILLAAAPGAEGRRTLAVLIPHEITHLLLAAKWKSGYASLPLWLVEGTAAGYEMEPRPEADAALREAAAKGDLIPIRTLCTAFPSEEDPALLAYAESKSFVGFLKDQYGLAALRWGMADYSGGMDCEQGLKAATGISLTEAEAKWIGRLSRKERWIPPAWILVLAGIVLLGGLWIVQLWIRRPRPRPPAGKEGAE